MVKLTCSIDLSSDSETESQKKRKKTEEEARNERKSRKIDKVSPVDTSKNQFLSKNEVKKKLFQSNAKKNEEEDFVKILNEERTEKKKEKLKKTNKSSLPSPKKWLSKQSRISLWDSNDFLEEIKQENQKNIQSSEKKQESHMNHSKEKQTSDSIIDDEGSNFPRLTEDQQQVVNFILQGKSVFFTGCAGTGKSTLLRYLIHILPKNTTFVTASTGIAAINIGGITLHSFAGIGLGTASKVELVEMVTNSNHVKWWKRAQVLIIDEISMVDAELFEKLDFIGKVVRRSSKPFGGIQLICSGDFLQLPPVFRKDGANQSFQGYCFESPLWEKTIDVSVELKTVFRQTQREFIEILDEIRHGNVSERALNLLKSCVNRSLPSDVIPTKLYPLNRDVTKENESQLSNLKSKGKIYRARDRGKAEFLDLLEDSPAPKELKLKEGSLVVLLRNLSRGISHSRNLVNGSQGIVVGFDSTRRGFPIVHFYNGEQIVVEPLSWEVSVNGVEVASRQQVPLKLAWALTIHRCQGSSLDAVEISLKKVFDYGQAYVALSRVGSLEGLCLIDFDPKKIRANPKVISFYQKLFGFQGSNGSNQFMKDNSQFKRDRENEEKKEYPYSAEYAKSARSTCKHCKKSIKKDNLRLGKSFSFNRFEKTITSLSWYHLNCFFASLSKDETIRSLEEIDGFEYLRVEDQQTIAKRAKIFKKDFEQIMKPTISNKKKQEGLDKTILSEEIMKYSNRQEEEELNCMDLDDFHLKENTEDKEEDEEIPEKKTFVQFRKNVYPVTQEQKKKEEEAWKQLEKFEREQETLDQKFIQNRNQVETSKFSEKSKSSNISSKHSLVFFKQWQKTREKDFAEMLQQLQEDSL